MNFFTIDIISLAVAFVTAIYILLILLTRCARINTKIKADNNVDETAVKEKLPPLSIIVYAPAWNSSLRDLICDIFNQNYNGTFEVIVVNAEKDSRTEDLISELQMQYTNLYHTFSPQKPKNLSPEKLALTIGIKAANFDCLVFTRAHALPSSVNWLRDMAQNFTNGADIVAGFARLDDDCARRLSPIQTCDLALESLRWLAPATSGKLLRADGFNLAYRKDLFFKNKGFSDNLNLMYGADDIFIQRIGPDAKAALQLSDSTIILVHDDNPRKFYNRLRMMRLFSSKRLPRSSYFLFGSVSTAAWIWLVASVLAVIFCASRFYVPIAVGAIFCALWIPLVISFRKIYTLVGRTSIPFALPVLMICRPLYTFRLKLKVRRNAKSFYAWGVYRPF